VEAQNQPAAVRARDFVDARRQPRFKVEVDISINSRTSGALKGHTVDISESGISAMLRIEVPVGELVELEFTLPFGAVTTYAMVRQRTRFAMASSSLTQTPQTKSFALPATTLRWSRPS
jgi:hypothetical protein